MANLINQREEIVFKHKKRLLHLVPLASLMLWTGSSSAAMVELAVNGDFESGDFTGWTQFPSAGTTQTVTTVNPASGDYAGNLNIPLGAGAVNNVLKQANLAAGLLTAGQTVSVSFDVRGSLGVGGVLFAENFSELTGGGVSSNDLKVVNGSINGNPDVWTNYSYNTILGPDVSGGFTLQLAAVCGADAGCFTDLYFDNVSVQADVVPIPAAVWLFGSGLGLLGWMRRRVSGSVTS